MTVMLQEHEGELRVKLGYGTWITKAVVGYFGIALLPLLGTSAAGVAKSRELRKQTLATIEQVGAVPLDS